MASGSSPYFSLQQTTATAPFLKCGKRKCAAEASALWADDPTPKVLLDG
jgi:hypothetical protein